MVSRCRNSFLIHATSISIDDPVLYFYVSKPLCDLLKITKINTKRGRVVYIRDSVNDIIPKRHHSRVYTRNELIDFIGGPLAMRFKDGGDRLPIMRKINAYVYGDGTCAFALRLCIFANLSDEVGYVT